MISAKKYMETIEWGILEISSRKLNIFLKGIYHAKISTIKDKNGMDLKKQKILRRGDKNTEEQTKSP